MSSTPASRTWRRLDLADRAAVEAMLPVHRASFAVQAEIMAFPELPPLHQTADDLAASGDGRGRRTADGRGDGLDERARAGAVRALRVRPPRPGRDGLRVAGPPGRR